MTGGIAEYLHNLWNEVGRIVPVTVMTTVSAEGKTWDRTYDFVNLVTPPSRRLGERYGDGFTLTRKIQTALYFRKVRNYAENVIDKIESQGTADTQVFIGIWWGELCHYWCEALTKAGIPYSIFVYGLDLITPFYGRLPRWRFEDLKGSKGVYACSRGSADLVQKSVGRHIRVEVVNPGITRYGVPSNTERKKRELIAELSISNKRVFLTVGRLVQRKGIDLVIKSVAGLKHEFPDLCYVVCGEGPERQRLIDLAERLGVSDRVILLGQVDEATKNCLYEMCEAFVMPNRLLDGKEWEGFGIVFLEAAMAGKPSIGGNNGGVPDAIEHGVTGLLVNTNEDERETTEALRRLLSDEIFRTNLGKLAKERAKRHFSWDRIGKGFIEFLAKETK